MVLNTSLLKTEQYKVRIKGKVEQSKQRSSYWKGSLLVTLDHGHQLYLLIDELFPNISRLFHKTDNFLKIISTIFFLLILVTYLMYIFGILVLIFF